MMVQAAGASAGGWGGADGREMDVDAESAGGGGWG